MISPNAKWRLTAFVVAIGVLLCLSIWAAFATWDRIEAMRRRFTSVQSESFHFADYFQQSILRLNNLLLRFQIHANLSDWELFLKTGAEVEHWITVQSPVWNTPEEQRLLVRLKRSFKAYLAAARSLEIQRQSGGKPLTSLAEFAPFQAQTERLSDLAHKLVSAHRSSLDEFRESSRRALLYLRNVLMGSLVLMVIFGAGLASVIYRHLIAPLRLTILESRELMHRQEKLASLGMLATGVAHEIRNPLTAMKARLFALQRAVDRDAPEQGDIEVIGEEINRLERIVRDFLMFARPSDPKLRAVDATTLLAEVRHLMGPTLQRAQIRLTVEPSEPRLAQVDAQQIKQVLINLVQNAADSIGEHGSIVLRARADTKRLDGHVADVVVLEVADTGKGIPPDVQKRLFDPFFTTKEGGTGLGLCIAARIVEKHGGALQYQSQVNCGSTFGIVVPRANPDELSR